MNIVLLIAIPFAGWLIYRLVISIIGSARWMDVINSLMTRAPDLYRELGEPELFVLESLAKGKFLANDFLWLKVIFQPGKFSSHPEVYEAVRAYRKFFLVRMCCTVLILAGLIVCWRLAGIGISRLGEL